MSRAKRSRSNLLKRLSSPPKARWPEGMVFHGTRLLLLVALATCVTVLFPPVDRPHLVQYELGMVADEDVIAQMPFSVPKAREELEAEQAEAMGAVPPTVDVRPEAVDSTSARVSGFFAALDSASQDGVRGVSGFLAAQDIPASQEQARLVADSTTRAQLRATALRAIRESLSQGVIDASQIQRYVTPVVVVRSPGREPQRLSRESLRTSREFFDEAERLLPRSASPDLANLLRLVLIRFIDYSYVLNLPVTNADRDAARRTVPTTRASILAGEAIVRANQQIGTAELERLNAYQEQLRNRGALGEGTRTVAPFLGSTVLNLMILSLFGLLLYFYRRPVYENFRWIALQMLLVAAYVGVGALVAGQGLPAALMPVAFAPLAVAVLWDGRMALVLALILAALTGVQIPFNRVESWIPILFGGAAAALSARAVRRRAQVWVFIAIISAAYAGAIISLGLMLGRSLEWVTSSLGFSMLNATVSSILVMGFLPVFEWFTGITTDQTLLEWADPNRPLLRRLSLEAPGTYAHTISVANLAEAAANAVGANGLLCRVGVYYHDIGKVLKPQYFIENQPPGRNPHDQLKPSRSAAIVREHVVEGEKLARDAKVPPAVAAFITEHHGTQLISFFYHKAQEEAADEEIPVQDFRYPGPRPRSKETAIALLADSVESATRVLQDPTPARVRDLIDTLVETRRRDGQLDDSPLTLSDVAVIREQFAKIIGGMYHQRIDYPTTRHLTNASAAATPETVGNDSPTLEREASS